MWTIVSSPSGGLSFPQPTLFQRDSKILNRIEKFFNYRSNLCEGPSQCRPWQPKFCGEHHRIDGYTFHRHGHWSASTNELI